MRTVLGLLHLLLLVARSGFRVRGAYWTWRMQTALGRDRLGRDRLIGGVLGYARWMERMRRVSR